MSNDVLMPQLGESVTEGTIVKWLKQPGDQITLYEPICEISTDKVTAEVPATVAGTLQQILIDVGMTVAVGEPICRILCTEAAVQGPVARSTEEPKIVESYSREDVPQQAVREARTSTVKRYSPAVLNLAAEHGLNLDEITGSGVGGRITRRDVLTFLEATNSPRKMETPIEHAQPQSQQQHSYSEGDTPVVLTPLRTTISRLMQRSKQEVPHAWTVTEVDVTGLVALRANIKDNFFATEGLKLTFMPFFIKAVVDSLKEFPYLNAVWQNGELILKQKINISVAISTPDGALYVPVIHDADEKSILGLTKALNQLREKVSTGKLGLADSQDGTFTVNNTGSFGSIISYPIINHPQVAIISLEKIVKRPVVINNMIAIRSIVNIGISFDHRVLDGLMAGNFLQKVSERLETYTPGMNI